MWSVTLAEGERGCEVADEERLLLDGGKDRLVDGLLVSRAVGRRLLLLSYC